MALDVRAFEPPDGGPARHLVQFYGADDRALARCVADFLDEGLRAGSAALIVALPEHTDAILNALPDAGGSADRAITCLDARATLDRFMVGADPDWRLFEQSVGGAVRNARRRAPDRTLRIYGEMVGLLWLEGRTAAAVCLEQFWNVLIADDDVSLFCGYPLDVSLDADGFDPDISRLLHVHSAVVHTSGVHPTAPILARAKSYYHGGAP